MKNPYDIIKERHITEKAATLGNLKKSDKPKYLFKVHTSATKADIKWAVEAIYREKKVKVTKVNTICVKPKPKRMRGRKGFTSGFKKAIVTLQSGESIEAV